MCLERVYRGKEKEEALAQLPESGYYWKTVRKRDGKYYPICFSLPNCEPFKKGWNKTPKKYIGRGYNVAFHLHRTKKVAQEWIGTTVRCIIKKKDIVAIGEQYISGYLNSFSLTIVTKRIWIPKSRRKHE